MSIVSVFVALMFTIILGMILNVARHVDDRMRLQNAADASTYAGAVTMARGMNTLAFSNHLLSEVFALTAYMREGRDRAVEPAASSALDVWEQMAPLLEQAGNSAGIRKFSDLGRAITRKVPYERRMVAAFSEMSSAQAEMTLPMLEGILEGPSPDDWRLGGYITRFQRAVVRTTPALAQLNADEIARRYAGRWTASHDGRPVTAMTYRAHTSTPFELASNNEEPWQTRTLPAVDPSPFGVDRPDLGTDDDFYVRTARDRRRQLAETYLAGWISDWIGPYFGNNQKGRDIAKMSRLIQMWRMSTCARLRELLRDEYRYTNLPHLYRRDESGLSQEELLLQDQTLVGVAHWNHLNDVQPGVFRNPLDVDGVDTFAFAQATIFIPDSRYRRCGGCGCNWGCLRYVTVRDPVTGQTRREPRFSAYTDSWPQGWDLFNQTWTAQLVPTTAPAVPAILSTRPSNNASFRPAPLGGMNANDVDAINFH